MKPSREELRTKDTRELRDQYDMGLNELARMMQTTMYVDAIEASVSFDELRNAVLDYVLFKEGLE